MNNETDVGRQNLILNGYIYIIKQMCEEKTWSQVAIIRVEKKKKIIICHKFLLTGDETWGVEANHDLKLLWCVVKQRSNVKTCTQGAIMSGDTDV